MAKCDTDLLPPYLPSCPWQVQWRVVTQTSNLFGAGTDASIMLQVWGPNGILGGSEICLDNSKV